MLFKQKEMISLSKLLKCSQLDVEFAKPYFASCHLLNTLPDVVLLSLATPCISYINGCLHLSSKLFADPKPKQFCKPSNLAKNSDKNYLKHNYAVINWICCFLVWVIRLGNWLLCYKGLKEGKAFEDLWCLDIKNSSIWGFITKPWALLCLAVIWRKELKMFNIILLWTFILKCLENSQPSSWIWMTMIWWHLTLYGMSPNFYLGTSNPYLCVLDEWEHKRLMLTTVHVIISKTKLILLHCCFAIPNFF